LVAVIAAMGLPFLVASIGERDLTGEEEQLAQRVRRAALEQRSSLSNSLASKVVRAEPVDGGIRVRHRFYTFFGLPWGWCEGTGSEGGEVADLSTGLYLKNLF
jgi:hypothetical protein